MLEPVHFFGVYSLLLIIIGTIGNILIFLICLRLKKNTTFILLRALSISDTISLYFWNLKHFMIPFYGIDIEGYPICRYTNFVQLASLQISAWTLVYMKNLNLNL